MNLVALSTPRCLLGLTKTANGKDWNDTWIHQIKAPSARSLRQLTCDLDGFRIRCRCCVIQGIVILLMTVLQLQVCKTEFSHRKHIDAVVIAAVKRQQMVGAAIGMIQQSKIVYTRGYGWSDLQTRIPATDETFFNWASNSKQLITMTALQLSQNGSRQTNRIIFTRSTSPTFTGY